MTTQYQKLQTYSSNRKRQHEWLSYGGVTSLGNRPMDSVQVGKAVFVKQNYTTLGIQPKQENDQQNHNHGQNNHILHGFCIYIFSFTSCVSWCITESALVIIPIGVSHAQFSFLHVFLFVFSIYFSL